MDLFYYFLTFSMSIVLLSMIDLDTLMNDTFEFYYIITILSLLCVVLIYEKINKYNTNTIIHFKQFEDLNIIVNNKENRIIVCIGGCALYGDINTAFKHKAKFFSELTKDYQEWKSKESSGKYILLAGGNKSTHPSEHTTNHGIQHELIKWSLGKKDVICACVLSHDMIKNGDIVDVVDILKYSNQSINVQFFKTHVDMESRRKFIGTVASIRADRVGIYSGGPGTVDEMSYLINTENTNKIFGVGLDYAKSIASKKKETYQKVIDIIEDINE